MPNRETGRKEEKRGGLPPTIPPGYTRSMRSLSSLYAPGYTRPMDEQLADHTTPAACTAKSHQAQEGRNTWVGGLSPLRNIKGVTVLRTSLRKITPLSA